ncbi:hypothetical protein BDR05DRAFT_898633 [Suillus weaverae]|nr:hypothetical protein BDR05DRAFT_898633 [Suillus weaverae]
MSSLNAKLGDNFLHISKLVVDRENWMTYKDRLSWSVDACGLLSHLEGTKKKPIDPSMSAKKEWRMDEAITKQQIATTIPDSLFIQIKSLKTAGEIFTYLLNLFKKCS